MAGSSTCIGSEFKRSNVKVTALSTAHAGVGLQVDTTAHFLSVKLESDEHKLLNNCSLV